MQSTGQTSMHELSLVPMHGSAMTYGIGCLPGGALSPLDCRGELFHRLLVFEPNGRRACFSLAGIDSQHHTTEGGRFDFDDRPALALHLDLSHGLLSVSALAISLGGPRLPPRYRRYNQRLTALLLWRSRVAVVSVLRRPPL